MYSDALPAEEIEFVRQTVNQAYWFYVSLGCSPDLSRVIIEGRDRAESLPNEIAVGWDSFSDADPFQTRIRISHELVHTQCQSAVSGGVDPILPMMWLAEGMANYFSDIEQYRYMRGGWGESIQDVEAGMAEWVAEDKCDFDLSAVEQDTGLLGRDYPDYPGIGEVAVMLLTKTSPRGLQSAIDYYVLTAELSKEAAFQQAFGRTLEEFYLQFREECEDNFPTLDQRAAPAGLEVIIDDAVPAAYREMANTTIPQAYAFYVALGCSTGGLRARIINGPGGENAVGAITVSIPETGNSPQSLAHAISGQMAQAMCQLGPADQDYLGRLDVLWLYEGAASYFSALERAASATEDASAQELALRKQVIQMSDEVEAACKRWPDLLSRLEPWDVQAEYPEFFSVSDLAARLLVTSSPDDVQAVMTYYSLLQDLPNEEAFLQAFGRTLQEFHQLFQEECENGFPAITN